MNEYDTIWHNLKQCDDKFWDVANVVNVSNLVTSLNHVFVSEGPGRLLHPGRHRPCQHFLARGENINKDKQAQRKTKCVYKMETSGKLGNPNGLCEDIWSLSSILYTCCIYLLQYVWKVLTGHFPSKGPCHLMLSCCGHPLKYFLSWEGVTDMVLECHLDLWWSMMIYDGVWWFLQEDQT